MKNFDGIFVTKETVFDKRLNASDKLLFSAIESLDRGEGCFASNEFFSRLLDTSERSITRMISRLVNLDLVVLSGDVKRGSRKLHVKHTKIVSQETENSLVKQNNGEDRQKCLSYIYNNNTVISPRQNCLPFVKLYSKLFQNKLGVDPKINYPRSMAILRGLYEHYNEHQIKALLFCFFEWRGVDGDSDFQNKKLRDSGFPIHWFVKGVSMYEAFLKKNVPEWDSENLKSVVDMWENELQNRINP